MNSEYVGLWNRTRTMVKQGNLEQHDTNRTGWVEGWVDGGVDCTRWHSVLARTAAVPNYWEANPMVL